MKQYKILRASPQNCEKELNELLKTNHIEIIQVIPMSNMGWDLSILILIEPKKIEPNMTKSEDLITIGSGESQRIELKSNVPNDTPEKIGKETAVQVIARMKKAKKTNEASSEDSPS